MVSLRPEEQKKDLEIKTIQKRVSKLSDYGIAKEIHILSANSPQKRRVSNYGFLNY